MSYSEKMRQEIAQKRSAGYSINELSRIYTISKSTLSGWLKHIVLSRDGITRISKLRKQGHDQARIVKNKQKGIRVEKSRQKAEEIIKNVKLDQSSTLLLCALIYWCEGAKNMDARVTFINSDPELIKTFLLLFRKSFPLDESKFRVCIHLHEYHSRDAQLNFWSKTTNIPITQFIKPYQKKNGAKRIREGYNGCASIRYHDVAISRTLQLIAKAFFRGLR